MWIKCSCTGFQSVPSSRKIDEIVLVGSQVTLSASLEAVTVRPASEASPSTAAAPEATQSSSPASAASPSMTSKV